MNETRETQNRNIPQSAATLIKQTPPTDVYFDWRFYVEYYEDLGDLSTHEAAHEHWMLFGQFEDRSPNKQALRHYLERKQHELPQGFDVEEYLELNPDLQQRFNQHRYREFKAIEHFLQHGKHEGRVYKDCKQLHQLPEQTKSFYTKPNWSEFGTISAIRSKEQPKQLKQPDQVVLQEVKSSCLSNNQSRNHLVLTPSYHSEESTQCSSFDNLIAADSFFKAVSSRLASPEIKVVSFDFFDTLVYRDVIVPTCAFYLIGLRLQEKGMLPFGIDAKRFHDLRILAETNARQQLLAVQQSSEVKLEEVYAQFPQGFFGTFGWQEALKVELVVEDTIIHAYLPVVELVQQCIQLGKQVIITSDTYFSAEQLRGFLLGKVDLEFLHIFSSSDQRTGKTNQLFEIVLQKLNIKPHQLLHIGDNHDSDVASPNILGIQTGFLPNGTSDLWQSIDSEVHSNNKEILDYIDFHQGDQGITSLRTKLLTMASPQAYYWCYGAAILGPVFHGFIRWVVSLQSQLSAETSLFLMREGEFLLKLLTSLNSTNQPKLNEQAQSHNQLFYISRRVVRQAAIWTVDRSCLDSLIGGRKLANVREFLSLIGLDASDLAEHAYLIETSLSETALKDQLFDFVLAQPKLCQKILTHAALKRAGLIAHLRSVLPAEAFDPFRQSSYRVSIVDIGWNGSIQKGLQQIVHQEGYKIDFFGCYLMTTESIQALTLEGIQAYGFLADSGRPVQEHQWIMRTVEILEQSCTASVGSLIDYTISGQPVVSNCMIPQRQLAQINEIQKGILAFHQIATLHIQQLKLTSTLKSLLRRILFRSVCNPTIDEVNLFQAWQHDENLMQQSAETLISGDITQFLAHMTPRQFLAVPMGEIYWPYGLAVTQSPITAGLLRAIAAQSLKLEEAESVLPTRASLRVDLGQGFASGSTFSTLLYRNLEGRTYIKLEIAEENIQGICFEPTDLAAILQINCINLTYWCHLSNLTHRLTFSGSQISSFAQLRGVQPMGATTYQTSSKPQIIFDFAQLGIRAVRQLKLEAGISLLLLDIADTDATIAPISSQQ